MERSKPAFIALLFLTSILIAILFLLAAVPPVSRDALTQHLAVPDLYIRHGAIFEIPDLVASYYPMNLDLLYALPLLFGNDILPKYIHMFFGFFTAILIFQYLARRLNKPYAIVGVLLFLSLPIIIQLSIAVYVDLGLIFFSTGSIVCLLRWYEDDLKIRYLALAGLLCGLALGTKYNGLVVFLIANLTVPLLYVRYHRETDKTNPGSFRWLKAFGYATAFAIIALIVFSPWAIRNYLWTQNPIFPLYDTLFNPGTPYVERKLTPFAIRRLLYNESLWQTLAVPIRIFIEGQDNIPNLFDGRLNPYLLFLPILAFIPSGTVDQRTYTEKVVWAGFAYLLIIFVFFTREMRIRYIAPAIPPLVILSVYGLNNIWYQASNSKSGLRRIGMQTTISIVIIALLLLNISYISTKWKAVQPFSYIAGEIDRNAYIMKYRPEYGVIQYANEHLDKSDRIACIFLGNRRYYIKKESYFIEWEQFREIVEKAAEPKDIADYLSDKDISHIIIGVAGLEQWTKKILVKSDQIKIGEFIKNYTKVLTEADGYALLVLKRDNSF